MIELKIRCEKDNYGDLLTKMHNALCGSPAYVNSEIALSDYTEEGPILIIGNNNEHDLSLEIEYKNIVEKESAIALK